MVQLEIQVQMELLDSQVAPEELERMVDLEP